MAVIQSHSRSLVVLSCALLAACASPPMDWPPVKQDGRQEFTAEKRLVYERIRAAKSRPADARQSDELSQVVASTHESLLAQLQKYPRIVESSLDAAAMLDDRNALVTFKVVERYPAGYPITNTKWSTYVYALRRERDGWSLVASYDFFESQIIS